MNISSKNQSVARSAQSGWLWSGIEQFMKRGIRLVVGIVLARMLEPRDFGLIASIAIFISMGQQLIDGGIAQGIIQKSHVTKTDYNALFYANLAISLLATGCLMAISSAVASFFNEPQLPAIMPFMAAVIFVMNAGRVQETRLVRELEFRKLSTVQIVSSLGGAVVGLTMAYAGCGVWALLGQQMAAAVIRAGYLWFLVPWRPDRGCKWNAIGELYSFGMPIQLSQLFRSISDQLVNVLIAHRYSPADLGFYDRGRLIPTNVGFSLQAVFNRTNFPILSKSKDNPTEFRTSYIYFLRISCGVVFLLMVGLMIGARDVIELLLGSKWSGAVWYMQASCITVAVYIVYVCNLDALRSLGYVKLFFRCNTIVALLQIIGTLAGGIWGLHGLVLGGIIGRAIGCLYLMIKVGQSSSIRFSSQIKGLQLSFGLSILLALLLYIISIAVALLWVRLACYGVIGTLFLIGIWRWESRTFQLATDCPESE